MEGVGGWVGDDHAGDVEGGVGDLVLGDAGVAHVDSVMMVRK